MKLSYICHSMVYKDEQEILGLISGGDQEGLKCLFDFYYKPLCVFAMNFLDSFEESEDIVQELFVKFWEKYNHSHFEGSLKAYLFSSVQHNCMKSLRKKNKYRFQTLENHMELPVYTEEDFETESKKLYEEIARLPEQSRKVFELIVLQDMKYKDVADTLRLSVNTVKTHFSRALKQLRGSLNTLILLLLSR